MTYQRIFSQWKLTGSLWVHGKRALLFGSLFDLSNFHPCESVINISVPRLYKMPWPCALLEGPRSSAYFFFLFFFFFFFGIQIRNRNTVGMEFRDVDKQKLCIFLLSFLVQLSARTDAYCDKLSQLYSEQDRGVQKPGDGAMSVWVMPETNAHARGARAYLRHPPVAGLDECIVTSSIPSPRVLELVKDLVRLHLPNLHTCVTSRPDFANYIVSSAHSDRRMGRWREEDKELAIGKGGWNVQ